MSIENSLTIINSGDLNSQSARQILFRKTLSYFLSLDVDENNLVGVTLFIFERLYKGEPDAIRIGGLIREAIDPFIEEFGNYIKILTNTQKARILESLLIIIDREYGGQEKLIAEYKFIKFLEDELEKLKEDKEKTKKSD